MALPGVRVARVRYLLDTNVLVEGAGPSRTQVCSGDWPCRACAAYGGARLARTALRRNAVVSRSSSRQLTAYYERLLHRRSRYCVRRGGRAVARIVGARLATDGRTPAFVDGQIAAIAAKKCAHIGYTQHRRIQVLHGFGQTKTGSNDSARRYHRAMDTIDAKKTCIGRT